MRLNVSRPLLFSLLTTALCSVSGGRAEAMPSHAAILWYAARSPEARANWLFGDDTCAVSDRTCNRCINNVASQFGNITDDPSQKGVKWTEWIYPPEGLDPYIGGSIDCGPFACHYQGFARVQRGGSVEFLGFSFGPSEPGLVGIAHEPTPGNWEVQHLYAGADGHPSGMFALGAYFGFANGDNRLQLLDVEDANWRLADQPSYEMPKDDPNELGIDTAGGGIAMARLRGGGYLLTVEQAGDRQRVDFFFIDGDLEAPARKQYLGGTPAPSSNNMSLITECGTGHLYLIQIEGTDLFLEFGSSRWVLAKIDWGFEDGPHRVHVDEKDDWTNSAGYCWPRGGASATALEDGRLEFLSVQRDIGSGFVPGDLTSFCIARP